MPENRETPRSAVTVFGRVLGFISGVVLLLAGAWLGTAVLLSPALYFRLYAMVHEGIAMRGVLHGDLLIVMCLFLTVNWIRGGISLITKTLKPGALSDTITRRLQGDYQERTLYSWLARPDLRPNRLQRLFVARKLPISRMEWASLNFLGAALIGFVVIGMSGTLLDQFRPGTFRHLVAIIDPPAMTVPQAQAPGDASGPENSQPFYTVVPRAPTLRPPSSWTPGATADGGLNL